MSVPGYELPWTGIVDTYPGPRELHALITRPEHPPLTHSRPGAVRDLCLFNSGVRDGQGKV
jgi:hypothetical protein